MRLFSWHGLAVLALAAGCGYVAGVGERNAQTVMCPNRIPSMEEEATPPPPPPPGLAFGGATFEGVRLDDIDLTCPPHFTLPLDFIQQTSEPPVADPTIHRTTFEFPAGGDGPTLPPMMPYLDDDWEFPCAFGGPLGPKPPPDLGVPGHCPLPRDEFTLSATEIAMGLGLWQYSPPQMP